MKVQWQLHLKAPELQWYTKTAVGKAACIDLVIQIN